MEEKNEKQADPVYSESAYDDAFRTMEGKCDDLVIPFVGHMFNENYGSDAIIRRLRNEHFVEHENGSEEKRITDSRFEIVYKEVTKKYHLECESKKYDGTILVRIFEYDSQIAKTSATNSLSELNVSFPNSGLLLLRSPQNAPESASINISVPTGEVVSYEVPIMKMSDYTIDDIFQKRLFMLIPFYIFNYEDQLSSIDRSKEELDNLLKVYGHLFDRLEMEQKIGNLSALSYSAIIKLTHSVAYKLTMKQNNVQKKVGEFMGGKILELPEFKIFEQGVLKGKEEGKVEGKAEGEAERKKLQAENDELRKELEELKALLK